MKRYLIIGIVAIIVLSGCSLLSNSTKYNNTVKKFTENLIRKNYDACINLLVVNQNADRNAIKASLVTFSEGVTKNFGTTLDYSFIKAEKTFSTLPEGNTPPNSTVVYVQFTNKNNFGIIQALFDDKSGKIISIKTLDVKERIPDMLPMWLFGILAICIPIFNIYAIIQVKRSNMRRKWQKYLTILILNVPTFGYNAITGFFFKLLSFQFLLGFSFAISDYLDTYLIFGLPIGAAIIVIKVKNVKYTSANKAANGNTDEGTALDSQ